MSNRQTSHSYVEEIKHVQQLLTEGSKTFPCHYRSPTFLSSKEFAASHKYLLIKSLKTLELLNNLAANKKTLSTFTRSKNNFTTSVTKQSKESNWSALIEKCSSQEGELTPGRVRGWQLKEVALAKNQLQSLSHTTSSNKQHKIAPFFAKDPYQEDLEEAEEWRKRMQPQEERQFHLTRITKIFSK
jgi:hypothetical protein